MGLAHRRPPQGCRPQRKVLPDRLGLELGRPRASPVRAHLASGHGLRVSDEGALPLHCGFEHLQVLPGREQHQLPLSALRVRPRQQPGLLPLPRLAGDPNLHQVPEAGQRERPLPHARPRQHEGAARVRSPRL